MAVPCIHFPCVCVVPGSETRVSCIPDKHRIVVLFPQPCLVAFEWWVHSVSVPSSSLRHEGDCYLTLCSGSPALLQYIGLTMCFAEHRDGSKLRVGPIFQVMSFDNREAGASWFGFSSHSMQRQNSLCHFSENALNGQAINLALISIHFRNAFLCFFHLLLCFLSPVQHSSPSVTLYPMCVFSRNGFLRHHN